MNKTRKLEVAVLLATYNGAQHIGAQIRSLKENATRFTLHWLDDHSTDDSLDAVRTAAQSADIELREWHQVQHQGVPRSYFQLMECVEADIYLFCDQDDIWQRGKIDAAVAKLLPVLASPALFFSDFLFLNSTEPEKSRGLADLIGEKNLRRGVQESRMFMPASVAAHTQAFTRPLRDLFITHKQIARDYAFMHDLWIYNVALACRGARMYRNIPTTLYRAHRGSFCGSNFGAPESHWIPRTWRFNQLWRRVISKHARGLILAAPTLPPGRELERLVRLARVVATLDRRQSPVALARLVLSRAVWPSRSVAAMLLAACLSSDAVPPEPTSHSPVKIHPE